MKLLVVDPGASMSTADVAIGLRSALRKLGHEVYEYALDQRIERSGSYLTYCWRRGGKTLPKPTTADILYHAGEELVARALRVMPDLVLVVSAMYLHPDVVVLMHRAGLKVGVLFTESPYDNDRQARLLPFLDVAWTNERTSIRPDVRYMPHAWNGDLHTPEEFGQEVDLPSHQVVFVGTGFQERIDLLSAVDWDGIDLGLYGSWDLLGSRHQLRRHLRGGYVTNARAAALYRRAAIGLNLYRQSVGFGPDAPRVDVAESLNPRAYELAAVGCFTVSDYRAEIQEVFGDLVPTFERVEDLRPLLDRWLADAPGRERARAALPGAVAGHTWLARARRLEADLLSLGLGGRPVQPVERRAEPASGEAAAM